MISVEVEREQLKKLQKTFKKTPEQIPKVIKTAINKAMPQVKKEVAEETKTRYTVSKKGVKEHIYTEKKATVSSLTGVLTFKGQKVKMIKFKTSPATYSPERSHKLKHHKAKILLSGSLKKLSGNDKSSKAFIAKMQSGHIGVFERLKGVPSKSNKKREKIKEIVALSVPQMFNNDEIKVKTMQGAADSITKNIMKETERILNKG